MTKSSVADWDTVAENNSDVGGINITGDGDISEADNAFREIMAQIAAAGFISSTVPVFAANLFYLQDSGECRR